MRIVVALGGHALVRRGEPPDATLQREHVEEAVAALEPLIREHEVVITHGNGPQVGLLAAESSEDARLTRPYPLDALVAQTQGLIGYWITQAVRNLVPGAEVVGLIDQSVVDADDALLRRPTKPVGPILGGRSAERGRDLGWALVPEQGGWRRVVGSPEPREVLEVALVAALLDAGATVCCAGGGGVPVVRAQDGRLVGVEAVVDKDLTASLLALGVGADLLVILTDVPGVLLQHGTPQARLLRRLTRAEATLLDLPEGSMGPKVEGALRFVEGGPGRAVIGDITQVADLVAGTAGTEVVAGA